MDIRVAVLDSMLHGLGRCADESSNLLAENLMVALELAIPVLGSLNERCKTLTGRKPRRLENYRKYTMMVECKNFHL